MTIGKRAFAALALVTSLGLVVPSTFGGSASADVSDHSRNFVETTWHCDLDADPTTYETEFKKLVSTFNSVVWQDTNSSTVIQQRLLADVLYSDYEVLVDPDGTFHDPTGDAEGFHEPTGYWFTEPDGHAFPQSKHKGQKRVNCQATVVYNYSPYRTEAFGHVNDLALVPEFVQADTCPENPEAPELLDPATGDYIPREEYVDPVTGADMCVTYVETDVMLFEATLSGKPGGVKIERKGGKHRHHKRDHKHHHSRHHR